MNVGVVESIDDGMNGSCLKSNLRNLVSVRPISAPPSDKGFKMFAPRPTKRMESSKGTIAGSAAPTYVAFPSMQEFGFRWISHATFRVA